MSGQFEIKGKTFLITGGASGLGALYAEAFLKEGAKNVAILDVAEAVGKVTTARLNASYPDRVIFIKCDVGSEEDVAAAFDRVLAEFQRLDVIINNAGIMSDAPAAWRKACDVNWQGLVDFTMRGLEHMRKDEGGAGGTIVNVSSTAALFRFRQLPIYAGSKMAVLHFSQSLAVEPFYETTGVRVLTICFGPTDTPLLQGLKERAVDSQRGDELDEIDKATSSTYQKPESAVAACIEMFTEGANGSIWLSVNNKPAQDITPIIDGIFNDLEKLIM